MTGTSLIAVLSTAAVSTLNFSSGGCVDPAAAAILGCSAMLSAPLGAQLTTRMDCTSLRRLLAYFLLCAAPLVPLKAFIFKMREEDKKTGMTGSTEKTAAGDTDEAFDAMAMAPRLAAIGVTAGLASGLLGIGGGTIVTPLLALVSPLPQAAVLGTSLLAGPSTWAKWVYI